MKRALPMAGLQVNRQMKLLFVAALLFMGGCSEKSPDGVLEETSRINSSQSGLVKIVENNGVRMIAKYLTPEYLAKSELKNMPENIATLDTLVERYSHNLNFYVTLKSSDSKLPMHPASSSEGSSGVDFSGVIDVEVTKGLFQLQSEDNFWTPVCVIPESRVGIADETWLVVFAVDPETMLSGNRTVKLVYSDPLDNGKDSEFLYNVRDLIHS
ncbi:MAG: hypothetical protein KDD67_01785 [Ignavibacteriae bacterium]|nr:hypothetical protein [Ignavibacteriota bacterium]MCB9215451.1 hypothetical protein [Ignavibacteria bacterium]